MLLLCTGKEVCLLNSRKVIAAIIEDRGITYAELGRRLDLSRATMWARVNAPNAKDVSASVLAETLEALGYKLAAVPKNTPLPEDAYTIT